MASPQKKKETRVCRADGCQNPLVHKNQRYCRGHNPFSTSAPSRRRGPRKPPEPAKPEPITGPVKVRNVKTEAEYFIRPEDLAAVGNGDNNISVFDHQPHNGGCKQELVGGVEVWSCFRQPSEPVKIFRGNYLERVTAD